MNLIEIKVKSILFLILFFGISGLAKSSQAATIQAASCSYADVSAVVAAASSGDTVLVPPGSCVWSGFLIINKPIMLQGAGAGLTNITGSVGHDASYTIFLITYEPADPISASDMLFRLTGFTFDANNDSRILYIHNKNTTATLPLKQIRIDHNSFLNTLNVNLFFVGLIYGVADNNTFDGASTFEFVGNQENTWNNQTFRYGPGDLFYIEDNIFTMTGTTVGSGDGWKGYVTRYNTFTYTPTSSMLSPWFDTHGNSNYGGHNALYGVMRAEIYGNVVTAIDPISGVKGITQRGSKMLAFFNKTLNFYPGLSSLEIWGEFPDSANPSTNTVPFKVNDSYYWNNRADNTLLSPGLTIDSCTGLGCGGGICTQNNDSCPSLSANVNWWTQAASFDGSYGVGCGSLAIRPASCSMGVGYWATNQSCVSVDSASVGAHPAQPISGTLYKCTASNTWTAYYTPYIYPHPLRGGADTTPPAAPSGLTVN